MQGKLPTGGYPKAFRQRVLTAVREKYGGGVEERFGPTLAAEHLESEDGLCVSAETLRRWDAAGETVRLFVIVCDGK